MDNYVGFFVGIFLVNQIITVLVVVKTREAVVELNQSIQRLCVFLSKQ